MKQLTNKKDERAAQRSALMLMRTAKLLDAGMDLNEMVEELDVPMADVQKWVAILQEARKQGEPI